MRFLTITLIFLYSTGQYCVAQQATIQPSIIVIPFATDSQDVRTVYEENIATRIAVSKVKEGFDNRGFTTVDFLATLKILNTDEVFTMGDLSDVKSTIIENSRADIYVEVDAEEISGTGGATQAVVILRAYDAFTGRALGDKTGSSPESRADYTRLIERALSSTAGGYGEEVDLVEDFLNVLQEKFTDIIENGRPIRLIFTLSTNAMIDFDSEASTGELLFDEIDFWLEENAYNSNYSDPRINNLRMVIDEVRIPMKTDRGRNYRPSRFARDIRRFLADLNFPDNGGGISVDSDIRGGTIYISIQ